MDGLVPISPNGPSSHEEDIQLPEGPFLDELAYDVNNVHFSGCNVHRAVLPQGPSLSCMITMQKGVRSGFHTFIT